MAILAFMAILAIFSLPLCCLYTDIRAVPPRFGLLQRFPPTVGVGCSGVAPVRRSRQQAPFGSDLARRKLRDLRPGVAAPDSARSFLPSEIGGVHETRNRKKLTPILFAQEIEPCIRFWTEKLAFQKTVEVPEGDRLGFALLEKDGVELMYQSYASVEKDNAATAAAVQKGPAFLYLEVEDLKAALAATAGAEMVMPVRDTFYGAREFGIKDPGRTLRDFCPAGRSAPAVRWLLAGLVIAKVATVRAVQEQPLTITP